MQEIELFPTLELGLLNGWILYAIWILVQGLFLLVMPKDVRQRLFELDRTGWEKRYRIPFAVGKLLALVWLVLITLTPLNIGANLFIIGLAVYFIGLGGLVGALINFRNTPLDRPVAVGFYRVSRHPQLVMLFIIGLGVSLALGSWSLLLLRIVVFGLEHAGVIAEEHECIERFGDSYKEYMERVPRYLLF